MGFDLWQVKSGTIFDNVLITDDVAEAKKIGDETWGATKDPEKAMKDSQDEEEKAKAEAEVNIFYLFINFFRRKYVGTVEKTGPCRYAVLNRIQIRILSNTAFLWTQKKGKKWILSRKYNFPTRIPKLEINVKIKLCLTF